MNTDRHRARKSSFLVIPVAALAAVSCADPQSVTEPHPQTTVQVRYTSVTAGFRHTCALSEEGVAYCWDAQFGARPVRIEAPERLTSLRAGIGFTCGLADTSEYFCWGRNSAGQFGDGTTNSEHVSTPVRVSNHMTLASIDAGGSHMCGVSPAGVGYCWGNNSDGQLGNGSRAGSTLPVEVSGGHVFTMISSGSTHSCGVTADRAAWCWGRGFEGQLGDGRDTVSLVPVPVDSSAEFETVSASFVEFESGSGHSCGITPGGLAVYCWGHNPGGQVGRRPEEPRDCPEHRFFVCDFVLSPVPVLAGPSFSEVAVGATNSCGLTVQGEVWCWGFRLALGDGIAHPSLPQPEPVKVAGGLVFRSISVGWLYACAVTNQGVAYCWGRNLGRESGTGIFEPALAPVRVPDPLKT